MLNITCVNNIWNYRMEPCCVIMIMRFSPSRITAYSPESRCLVKVTQLRPTTASSSLRWQWPMVIVAYLNHRNQSNFPFSQTSVRGIYGHDNWHLFVASLVSYHPWPVLHPLLLEPHGYVSSECSQYVWSIYGWFNVPSQWWGYTMKD